MSEPSNLVQLDAYLSVKDVTSLVGISTSTLYRWIDDGTFPRARQLSVNCVRWPASEVKAWLESRPVANGERGAARAALGG